MVPHSGWSDTVRRAFDNEADRQGWIPASRQITATVASPMPRCLPNSRVDQCVTPYFFGGGRSVAAMTLARSTRRGRPERGSSTRPARPLPPNLARQTNPTTDH